MGVLIILAILVSLFLFSFLLDFSGAEVKHGVTFSHKQAEDLGLDWQNAYLAALDELKIKHLRLVAYWDEIEKEKEVYDFSYLDWQLEEAQKRGVQIILSVGRRVPRWPECHVPAWAADYSKEEVDRKLLNYIKKLVERYKNHDNLIYWQVENEPFLRVFGLCPKPDPDFLEKEVSLVKSLDSREILISDSGELSSWYPTAKRADILGTTVYRIVWNKYFGYFHWFLPPAWYHYKAKLITAITPSKKVIVTELQAEPWGKDEKFLNEIPIEEQLKEINLETILEHAEFTRKAGFDEAYFWGVEWWYWLKINGEESVWEGTKKLFRE